MKHIVRCAGLIALVTVLASAWQPRVSTQPARKKLLFLTHAGLYKHSSLGPAEKAVTELGKAGGYYLRSIVPMNLIAAGKVGLLKVEDTTHPATKMLGASWPIDEEFYQFGGKWDASRPEESLSQVGKFRIPIAFTRDRIHVSLSLDTDRMDISDVPQIKKGGDYPQAWSRTYGSGRVFYTSLGHREESWSDPVFRAHINSGIRYALGIEK